MNHEEQALKIRSLLADRLNIDPARLTVRIRGTGQNHEGEDTSQMTVLIDGKEPEGPHRWAIIQWAQTLEGKEVGLS